MDTSDLIEELIRRRQSKYVLTAAIALRAKALIGGAKALSLDLADKPDVMSMKEILSGQIEILFDPNAPRKPAPPPQTANPTHEH